MKTKLSRLQEIRDEVRKLYAEKEKLEQEVIDNMVLNDLKEIDLNDNGIGDELVTLKWVFETKLDYERLQALYPKIYEQGLITSFSVNRALKSVDKKLLKMIIDDCRTARPHYEIRYKKKKKGK